MPLGFEREDLLSLHVEESIAGAIPVLVARHRSDFVRLVRALTARLVDVSDGDIKIVYEWAQLGSHDCVNGSQDAPKLVYRKTDKRMDFHAEPAKRACSAAPAASSAAPAKAPPKK